MNTKIEIQQNEKGVMYIEVYSVYATKKETNETEMLRQYTSEKKAEEYVRFIRIYMDDTYETAFIISTLVFI